MALLTITVKADPADQLLTAVGALAGPDRVQAHKAMAAGLEAFTQEYVRGLPSRKGSAAAIGGTPSGFYRKAAGSIEAMGNETGILLRMQRAGLSRAFRAYDLRPLRGKLLTIPVAGEAYGKRAREFGGLKWRRFSDEDKAAGRTTHAGLVLGRPPSEPGGLFQALFRGAKRVHQPQDRRLLPDDRAWLDEAGEAALNFLEERLSAAGAA